VAGRRARVNPRVTSDLSKLDRKTRSNAARSQPAMSTASYSLAGFDVNGALSVQDLKVEKVSNDMVVSNQSSDADIKFSGSDAGSSVTALTLDMSEAGAATFNAGVTANGPVTVTTTAGALTVPRMTTTQRNALTAAVGMIIYNTSTSKFQGYAGSSWVDLH